MPTPGLDAIEAEIQQGKMKVGNRVVDANNNAVTGSVPLSVDVNGLLQALALFPITQPVITEGVVSITGTGAQDIMTQTLVSSSDATTWTKTGWIRVKITDAGGRLTNGYHYLQVGTLT